MKQRVVFFLCVVVCGVGVAAAQERSVTNAELEKFKQKRLQAEKELKEYYARNGVTEEELAKREAASAKEREELSARLRAARLEQERIDAEARIREVEAAPTTVNIVVPEQNYGYPGYFTYTDPYFGRKGRWVRPTRYPLVWRATPMGVIYEPGSRPASIYSPQLPQRQPRAWRPTRRPR